MDQKNNGGPAFPEQIAVTPTGDTYSGHEGMTMRDYFAAKALSAVINMNYPMSDIGYVMRDGKNIGENYAICAYELADAMLAARSAA